MESKSDRQESKLLQTESGDQGSTADTSLAQKLISVDSKTQNPKEYFTDVMCALLPGLLCDQLPQVFKTPLQVNPLKVSGLTAFPFECVMQDSGERLFLKLRPFSPAETKLGYPLSASKDYWVRSQAASAGVAVAPGIAPLTLKPSDLPESLKSVKVKVFDGEILAGDSSFVVVMQKFIEGIPARFSLEENTVQTRALHELGAELRKLHSIAVNGFGANFDPHTQSFSRDQKQSLEDLAILRKSIELHARGIISPDTLKVIERSVELLERSLLVPVLCHMDLNPGNYLIKTDGALSSLVDWDSAEGAPWQHEVARALHLIEASPYGVPRDSILPRVKAFLDGYGLSKDELMTARPVIDAFRISVCVNCLNALYVRYDITHVPHEHLLFASGEYERRDRYSKVIAPEEPDWRQMVLAAEHTLLRLAAASKFSVN